MKCIVHKRGTEELKARSTLLRIIYSTNSLCFCHHSAPHTMTQTFSPRVSWVKAAIRLCTKYLWKNLDCEDSLCKIHLWDLKVRVQGLLSPRNAPKLRAATCTGKPAWGPPSRHRGSSPYQLPRSWAHCCSSGVILLLHTPCFRRWLDPAGWPALGRWDPLKLTREGLKSPGLCGLF